MIPSDSEHTSAQQKPAPTSSAPSTRSSRRGGDQGRRGKEPSSSATREQHPPSSRESEKMRGSVDSDDEGRKVAGGSRREEEEDVKMESVDGHQVAKRSLDFGIDPSVRVVPATALSRCRQIILPPLTPIASAPISSQPGETSITSPTPSSLSSGRKLLDVFQDVVERRPLEQQAKVAHELYLYVKTILEAPLIGYNFVVLGFTHIEIVCAVQAAIAKLGGRYLLEKELETMKSEGEEEEQITNVDFVLISNSLSLPLPNNNSPLAKAINTRSLNILRPGNDIKLPSSDLLSSSASRRSEVLVSGAFFEEVVGICLRENASSETET